MNLNSLSVSMMLNLSGNWLAEEQDNTFLHHIKQVEPLGPAVLAELLAGHAPLAKLQTQRRAARQELQKLIALALVLDLRHDRKARALYYHLRGLIEGSDDQAEVELYQALFDLLFPAGLSVVNLTYIEEGGAAMSLEQAVDAQTRAKLEEVGVGKQTLDELFVAWVDAGKQLGKAVKRRAEVEAALGKNGSANLGINIKSARSRWIQGVRGLLWAVDINPELRPLQEGVVAALDQAIATAQRRRAGDGGLAEADELEASGGELPAVEPDSVGLDDELGEGADEPLDAEPEAPDEPLDADAEP